MGKNKFKDDIEIEPTEEVIKGFEVCGDIVDPATLICGSCLNPVTGVNSLNHPNRHVVEHKGQTVVLCSDCDRKFKANPNITPALFYEKQEDGRLLPRRFDSLVPKDLNT